MASKILFVDDDEGNLVVCEAHFGQRFEVITCGSGHEALQIVEEQEVGVVVADQRMPEFTGVDLCEEVRRRHPQIVRLLISAYSDLDAAIAAINRGHVRRYIKKPWQPDEVGSILQDALDFYEMGRKVEELSQRLAETERVYSLGLIAASIAHEIRNPIGWIRDNVQNISSEVVELKNKLAPEQCAGVARPHLQEICESLEDAQTGVDRILGIVQGIDMPSREVGSVKEPVNLDTVVQLALNLLSPERRRSVDFVYEAHTKPEVMGTQTKVSQIVLNLLVNAVQALSDLPDAKRRVRVGLDGDEQWACLTVGDSGRGVPGSDREKIFSPFYTTKGKSGTGLGLAICRQITAELNGSLRVRDDELLGGALFELKLPLFAPGDPGTAPARQQFPPAV